MDRRDRDRDDPDRRRDRSRSRSRDRDHERRPRSPPRRVRAVRRGPTGWDVQPLSENEMSEEKKQRLRNGRRLYVGNLGEATEQEVERFFSDLVFRIAIIPPKGAPILSVYISAERKFAFVEFCSIELANAIVQLDGLVWNNTTLKIRRPVDYNPGDLPTDVVNKVEPIRREGLNIAGGGMAPGAANRPASNIGMMGGGGTGRVLAPNRLFFGGLPRELNEANLSELLSPFGPTRTVTIVRGPEGVSKGYGFAEMVDQSPQLAESIIATLNGVAMGAGRTITVSKATNAKNSQGGGQPEGGHMTFFQQQAAPGGMGAPTGTNTMPLGMRPQQQQQSMSSQPYGSGMPPPPPGSMGGMGGGGGGLMGGYPAPQQMPQQQQQQYPGYPPAPIPSAAPSGLPSTVVVLDGMVAPTDLLNDDDHADLVEDVAGECSKYGALAGVQVPRPPSVAAGRVFLHYVDIASAIGAATALAGRQFGGKPITARYYDEGAFRASHFTA